MKLRLKVLIMAKLPWTYKNILHNNSLVTITNCLSKRTFWVYSLLLFTAENKYLIVSYRWSYQYSLTTLAYYSNKEVIQFQNTCIRRPSNGTMFLFSLFSPSLIKRGDKLFWLNYHLSWGWKILNNCRFFLSNIFVYNRYKLCIVLAI